MAVPCVDSQCGPQKSFCYGADEYLKDWKAKLEKAQGPFKYYVIKEVGVWGQKMAIFDDLQ